MDDRRRVVVGVDGSTASVRALAWCLELADSGGVRVEVVTVWPMHAPVVIGEVPGHFTDARWQAVAAQRQAVALARDLGGSTAAVEARLVNAAALVGLRDASIGAAMVVVGATPVRGTGRQTLAEALQTSMACPVLEVSASGSLSVPMGDRAFAE